MSDHACAVVRADLVLVSIYELVDGCRIEESFLDQKRFDRLHSERDIGGLVVVFMVVFMVVLVTHWSLPPDHPDLNPGRWQSSETRLKRYTRLVFSSAACPRLPFRLLEFAT